MPKICDDLRQAVLQEAIQGKLTEQLKSDGNARDLLKEIKAEKEALIKAGKLKKEKPLAEISEDEIPFDIPENWEWVRLPEVAISGLGKTLNSAKDTGEVKKYLCSINVYWNGIDVSTLKEAKFNNKDIDKYLLQKGDLLICEGGDVGRSAIWNNDDIEMYYQNALHRVRFFAGINPNYFLKILWLYKQTGIIDEVCKGETIKHLVQGSLYNLVFPLPPLAEQHRIVAKVEKLMAEIDELEKIENELIALKEAFPGDMKAALLQEAMQGKLTEQLKSDGNARDLLKQIKAKKEALIKAGKLKKEKPLADITEDEVPFDIPENWEWVRLGNVFNIGSAKRVHQSDWRSQGVPFYRAREIGTLADIGYVNNDLYIDEDLYNKYQAYGVPLPNDIMVTAVGTLGKTYIVKSGDRFYYKDASVLCFHNILGVNARFFQFVINSPLVRVQINDNVAGTTVGTITIDKANNYLIPLPPLAEQERIVAKLDKLLPLVEGLKEEK